MDADQEFHADIDRLKIQVEAFLESWYGERCPDYEAGCIICRQYERMDQLLEDPSSDY